MRQLGLREVDELDTEVDKRDFGNWLHEVLRRFRSLASPAGPGTERARRLARCHGARRQ
ncbi:MAG: hypothetical protein IPO19_13340 [Rhodoferax sp.]|nr:hypothetical protein [Rhodoferax sp.]